MKVRIVKQYYRLILNHFVSLELIEESQMSENEFYLRWGESIMRSIEEEGRSLP